MYGYFVSIPYVCEEYWKITSIFMVVLTVKRIACVAGSQVLLGRDRLCAGAGPGIGFHGLSMEVLLLGKALLHKSATGRTTPIPRRT